MKGVDEMKWLIKFSYADVKDETKYPDGETRKVIQCAVLPNDKADTSEPVIGKAVCNPCDQYVKEKGRRIALTKAIAGLDRSQRTSVWSEYWRTKEIHRLQSLADEYIKEYMKGVR